MVPKLAPLSMPVFGVWSRGRCLKCAKIWPYFLFPGASRGSEGRHVGIGHSSDAQHVVASRAPPPRLVVCPEVRVGCPSCQGLPSARLPQFVFMKSFLPPFFCSTQLPSFSRVPEVPCYPLEELMVLHKLPIRPILGLISQPGASVHRKRAACAGMRAHSGVLCIGMHCWII